MRKISGGKYKKARKKKLAGLQGKPGIVKLGKEKKKKIRTRGGKQKVILLSANKANVYDSKTKKTKVVAIKSIIQIPSNRFFKDVLVKGTIIDTELGKARITNKPSQEGCVQAKLF